MADDAAELRAIADRLAELDVASDVLLALETWLDAIGKRGVNPCDEYAAVPTPEAIYRGGRWLARPELTGASLRAHVAFASPARVYALAVELGRALSAREDAARPPDLHSVRADLHQHEGP